jgi:hypothetical protein
MKGEEEEKVFGRWMDQRLSSSTTGGIWRLILIRPSALS